MFGLEIVCFAQASDNYAWLIVDHQTKQAALVDAVNGLEIQKYLDVHKLNLSHILNTHHHYDHVGANKYLFHKDLIVCGSEFDLKNNRIPHQNKAVSSGDMISFGQYKIKVLDIPGHTLGHIAYVIQEHVFCGDTIFLGGCGRVFEGTHEQMYNSIKLLLESIPKNSLLYPAHEYSMSNLNFAKHLLNDEITKEAICIVQDRLAINKTSLPTASDDEKKWNPFYRVNDPNYLEQLTSISKEAKKSSVIAFAEIRLLKDQY